MEPAKLPPDELHETVSELWGLAYQPEGCLKCGQAFLAPAEWAGAVCPHCLAGQLEPQPARLRREPPELVQPFQRDPAGLRPDLEAFTRGVWLAQPDFTPADLQQRLVAVYWPTWLVDGKVSGTWQAEVGFDYQVKSSQEFYASGGWQSRELLETRVRWEPRLGTLERDYANLAVPALSDSAHLAAWAEAAVKSPPAAYSPQAVRGAVLRIPDLSPEEAWAQAEKAFNLAAVDECRQAASGQHVRSYQLGLNISETHWTQLLSPLYVTFYTDDQGRRIPVMIDGVSGRISGKRLASTRQGLRWAGVCLLLALALFVLAVAVYLLARAQPGLTGLSSLLWLLGFGAAGFAAVPAAWPLLWNRKQ